MNPKDNSQLHNEQEIDDSLVLMADGRLVDPYDLVHITMPKGPIYCKRYDDPEGTLAEEKRLEEQEKMCQKAKEKKFLEKQKHIYTNNPNLATHIVLRVSLQTGRAYTIAEARIQDASNVETEAEKLFEQYYGKLDNKFIHTKKPTHQAIRCSSIEVMFITYR